MAGRATGGLGEEERVVQRLALAVARERRVDDDLFAAARAALGDKGVVDALVLIGSYQTICSFLTAFEVPVPSG